MPRREKVSKTITDNQRGDLTAIFVSELGILSSSEADAIEHKLGAFRKDIRKFLSEYKFQTLTNAFGILDLEKFYREVLGMEVSLADIRIPEAEDDFSRALVIHKDLSKRFNGEPIEGLFQIAKSRFGAWKYASDSLDKAVPTNERHPMSGSYAILVRDRVEADEENANLSANDIAARGTMNTETVLERIFHELFHHWKTGKHLDEKNWTLCSGSRNSDGNVPNANWNDDKFNVNWYNPTNRNPNLRPRSLQSFTCLVEDLLYTVPNLKLP